LKAEKTVNEISQKLESLKLKHEESMTLKQKLLNYNGNDDDGDEILKLIDFN
jgi:hypothetical protein